MHNLARRVPILAAVLVLVLGAAAPAGADPIQLVSGRIVYSRLNPATFIAGSSDGPLVHGDFGNFQWEVWNPAHACFDCIPGSSISLSQSESLGTGDDTAAAGGSVRVGDVDYWIESMAFQIAAGTFVLPDTTNASIRLTSPFTFTGVISGRTLSGEARTFTFAGSGSASALFADNDWFDTTYAFAAATPEPGTLLLIGGPALLALRRRKQDAV
jgi:hypothetical protein